MISVERSVVVNDGSAAPLTVDQVWAGLIEKAENPTPYVPDITECEVVERFEQGLVRDIVNFGKPVREVVTFYPKELVHFVRTKGETLGTIDNELGVDEHGQPLLTFRFRLVFSGVEPHSPEEDQMGAAMAASYLDAVRTTLNAVRERIATP